MNRKLASALERMAQVFKVLLLEEGGKHQLSPLQVELLVFLLHHPKTLRTVTQLAREFNVSKATISIALRPLLAKKLIERSETSDLRSFSINLTSRGKILASQLNRYAAPVEQVIEQLAEEDKSLLLQQLLTLLYQLQKAGIIHPMRMCFTCSNYSRLPDGSAYCQLLQKTLQHADLRIDCPEHQAA
ncbi:MAG: MarR family transcriptional regulator [Chitinophagales bacterium]|nr:MarR family transcriptional regulator [Chitinophagales bacterium]MDW8392876.1 MarR family transcriptional regulator [Chitinophagales bacterium]